jgi:two-component system, response regulator PdtaR
MKIVSANRILFADDDRLVLATMARGLREAGFEVTTADSGEQAIEVAKGATFDLALLDIRMPGLSGIEAAQQLRDTYGLPAMFMTAYGEQELVCDAIDNGGLAYVMKPIDISQLIPAISTALARARDLRVLREIRSQLEQALAIGRETSMAIGIVMERRGLGEQAAFELLRTNARKQQRKLNDYCHDLVNASERLNCLITNDADSDSRIRSTR